MPAFTEIYQAERRVPALPTVPYLTRRLCVRLYNSPQKLFYLLLTGNTKHLKQISIRPILHVYHNFPLYLFTSHYNKLVHTIVCAIQTFLCLSS
jgi:hypothetical protein